MNIEANKSYLLNEKGGGDMPNNEKELNCYLFDQLTLLERLEIEAQKDNAENVLRQIAFEKNAINRKLYQKPPLVDN